MTPRGRRIAKYEAGLEAVGPNYYYYYHYFYY